MDESSPPRQSKAMRYDSTDNFDRNIPPYVSPSLNNSVPLGFARQPYPAVQAYPIAQHPTQDQGSDYGVVPYLPQGNQSTWLRYVPQPLLRPEYPHGDWRIHGTIERDPHARTTALSTGATGQPIPSFPTRSNYNNPPLPSGFESVQRTTYVQDAEGTGPPLVQRFGRPLGEGYEVKPNSYYEVGVVFERDWPEPGGSADDASVTTIISEDFFVKQRRFVVIDLRHGHCGALPIHTYRFQGVAKAHVKKSEHCIVYTGPNAPFQKPGERERGDEKPMKPYAIRIETTDRTDKLHDMSRLNLGKVIPVEYNIRVRDFGRVENKYLEALKTQYNQVNQERHKSQTNARKKRRQSEKVDAGSQFGNIDLS